MDKLLFTLFCLHLKVIPVWCDCPRNVDVCDPINHEYLDDPDRSSSYLVTFTAATDYSLEENWYRSVSGVGGDMPDQPVSTGQCTAYAPIWLNGHLPYEADGIVEEPACASFLDDPCVRQYNVSIRNCSHFNVYCLGPTFDSFDRWCMGTEEPCPPGAISDTGFTPDCTECITFDLTYDKKGRFEYAVTRADHRKDVKFQKCYQGSDKTLKIDLVNKASAKVTMTPDTDSAIRVRKFCVDTKRVEKTTVELFDGAGQLLHRVSGKEQCLVNEDISGVREIKLKFKKKSGKASIKLSNLFIEACNN